MFKEKMLVAFGIVLVCSLVVAVWWSNTFKVWTDYVKFDEKHNTTIFCGNCSELPKINYTTKAENSDNSSNTTNDAKTETIRREKCQVCGTTFTGRGYEEVSNNQWRLCEEPHLSWTCSPSCGIAANNKLRELSRQLENESRNNTSDDYYSNERERMRRRGYTEGEINQMRDPNKGDPEIQKSMERINKLMKEKQ